MRKVPFVAAPVDSVANVRPSTSHGMQIRTCVFESYISLLANGEPKVQASTLCPAPKVV
jgi:hypothetical protein